MIKKVFSIEKSGKQPNPKGDLKKIIGSLENIFSEIKIYKID